MDLIPCPAAQFSQDCGYPLSSCPLSFSPVLSPSEKWRLPLNLSPRQSFHCLFPKPVANYPLKPPTAPARCCGCAGSLATPGLGLWPVTQVIWMLSGVVNLVWAFRTVLLPGQCDSGWRMIPCCQSLYPILSTLACSSPSCFLKILNSHLT